MTKAQAIKIKQLMKVLKAVKLRCLDCSAYSSYEVKKCCLIDCPLYPYRFGTLNDNQKIPLKKCKLGQKNE